jgi:hypothetical protein
MTDHGTAYPDRADHEYYERWDAAYVLGALSSAERREFEEHLSGCPRCASAVAELAAMPGLLAALPSADAVTMLEADAAGTEPEPTPPHILAGLTARVRRRRRARAWGLGIGGVAAAAAIVAATVLPMTINAPAAPTVSASLAQVVRSPLSASVRLTSVPWGTRIAMTCTYGTESTRLPSTAHSSTIRYALYITDRSGTTTRVSSWNAGPGSTVHTDGSVDTAVSEIASVELRSLNTGTVLLSRTLD